MKKALILVLVLAFIGSIVGVYLFFPKHTPISILPEFPKPSPDLPLLKYRIETMHESSYSASNITVEKMIKDEPTYTSYLFSFETTQKKMTGLLNIPKSKTASASSFPVLVMVRGYIPPATYQSGAGTKSAAEFFAAHGYVTVAPDFLGFGGSDPESSDIWEARFQKPIQVAELIKTVQMQPEISIPADILKSAPTLTAATQLQNTHVGMWAHSNGGQIALTTLEILNQPIPTTLWAPVTAPFPYSVLYFSDEEADEGKASREWINEFDQKYDALEFSLSQHLNLLTGPLQLHQGVADEAIHYIWSDEFVDKIKAENTRRKPLAATASAEVAEGLKPIEITYYKYPNSNHNMQPDWSTIIQRDEVFFDKSLK